MASGIKQQEGAVTNSIRIKFSVFLAVLLLLTVFVLSLLVLEGIKRNQQSSYEQYLAQQAVTANIFFIQTILAEPSKVPEAFLASEGEQFAERLALISGQSVVLYDREGAVVSSRSPARLSDGLKETLTFALDNKTAYWAEHDSLYYMTPLRVGNDQVGVVQFYYSLSENLAFYNQIRQLFIWIGGGVFMLSFVLAYVYFNSFANTIIRLNRMVNSVREGRYETTVLKRKDEMGTLSEGIHAMSEQIKGHIEQQKQFIGNVTHEFKTPLTSVKAYLDLLDMYPDDPKLLETAKATIRSETERLYEMVDKVLQLSALEKYDFEFSKERLDIRQVVVPVLDGLKGKMDKFGIQLEQHLTEVYAEADKDILTIILANLLDNAIKYNKPRGRIVVKNYLKDGRAVIEVADTGIGIPDEVARQIFEPFYTVDKNRSRQSGGVGLGLALAKKYAESQEGSVELVQTGTEGTTFRVSLPACDSSGTGGR
ncbi:HAMP domain-containing protein [Paenibacillus campinasensis]|uniref:histidine kinase n=1 Tax=Paenibacillus campinasensis TaxID=66347 RepID=A0ABW9TBZ4_9BACL|nr:HAMP domain-containing protein [Paenibacillus campinasensis]